MNQIRNRIVLHVAGLAAGAVLACLALWAGSQTHFLILRATGVNTSDLEVGFWLFEFGLIAVAISGAFSGVFEEMPLHDPTFTARNVLRNAAILPFETALTTFIISLIIAPVGSRTDGWVSPLVILIMFVGFFPLLFIVRDLAFDIGLMWREKCRVAWEHARIG